MMEQREVQLNDKILEGLVGCAGDGRRLLGVTTSATSKEITGAINESLRQCQKGHWPEIDPNDDLCLMLGSLWGQQLVREFGWLWIGVEVQNRGSDRHVGVASPDRSYIIYPFRFVEDCLTKGVPVTVSLAFDLLKDGQKIPERPERAFEDVMKSIGHIVPLN